MTQHEIIRATVPLTVAARERAALLASDDALCAALVDYLDAHVEEELGHDEVLLNDLAALGIDRASVLARLPSATVAQLVGAQYYWIAHHHPLAFLGFVAVMEGCPPTADVIETLVERTGLPRTAFRTYEQHAELDPGHRDHLDATLDALPLSAEHEEILGVSAMSTAALLPQTVAEVLALVPLGGHQ
jgi:pyrroloquinoline quinone (PQQ) biosynthesis protein C